MHHGGGGGGSYSVGPESQELEQGLFSPSPLVWKLSSRVSMRRPETHNAKGFMVGIPSGLVRLLGHIP